MAEYRSDANPNAAIVTVMPVNDGGGQQVTPRRERDLYTQHGVALTFPTSVVYYTSATHGTSRPAAMQTLVAATNTSSGSGT